MEADHDKDGKISFEEFTKMVENTDVSMSMTLGGFRECASACTSLVPDLPSYASPSSCATTRNVHGAVEANILPQINSKLV